MGVLQQYPPGTGRRQSLGGKCRNRSTSALRRLGAIGRWSQGRWVTFLNAVWPTNMVSSSSLRCDFCLAGGPCHGSSR